MEPLCSFSTGMRSALLFSAFGRSFSGRDCRRYIPTQSELNFCSSLSLELHDGRRRSGFVSSALPETAASIVVAAVAVGAAATILTRRTKESETDNSSLRTCEDCGGSGLCSDCNGEGFILKKMSDESADRARMAAKNMATRYTAGLPKKWTYCFKCNAARSCIVCKGAGQVQM